MSVLGAISAGVGLAGSIAGALGSRSAARRQRRLLDKQRAANEAWYARNYYGDYLNSVEAMNAMRRVNDTIRERSQAARARAAVTGATPEQSVAIEAANGRNVADLMGNLAAQGDAYRRHVDERKQQMDAGVNSAAAGIAEAQQGANAQLMSAGLRSVMNGLSQFDFSGLNKEEDDSKKKEDKK